MKILVLGDIHGRTIWKQIVEKENPEKVIFLGDYVSTHEDIDAIQQIDNLEEILRFKKANSDKVILLRGNHDTQHLGYKWAECSGYNFEVAQYMQQEIKEEFLENTQWVYREGNIIFSHAGVSKVWMENNDLKHVDQINELPPSDVFGFTPDNSFDYCGTSKTQPPTWIRLRELCFYGIDNYIQVVGHTPMQKVCNVKEEIKWSGVDIWACDCLPKEYLIIEDNEFIKKEISI
jgi:predicted phosphodiesterase